MKVIISFVLVLSTISILITCTSKKTELFSDQPKLLVFNDGLSSDTCLASQFFDKKKVVVLETTNESLISQINRIYSFNNKFYILDKRSKSVYIFQENGKFIKRIKRLGSGPGEYTNLTDFTIDLKNRQLILLCDIPNSLIYLDLDGNYLNQKFKNRYERYISADSTSLYYISYLLGKQGKYIRIENNGKDTFHIDYEDFILDKKFYGPHPNIILSNNVYYFKVYDKIIYKLSDSRVFPAYEIDIGERFLNIDYVRRNSLDKIITSTTDDEIYRVSDFRESNRFLTFTTYPYSKIAIYDKNLNSGVLISEFYDNETGLHLKDHIAHDGQEEEMMFLFSANTFKYFVLNKKGNRSAKNYKYFEGIANQLNMNDNPVLVIYELKTIR